MRRTPWRSASLWLSDSFTIPASLARWIPTTSMLLVSLISYIDRNTLALLIPTIMKETKLSAEQYGFIVSAFSIAYMISNPLWGGLLDRLGLRIGMTLIVTPIFLKWGWRPAFLFTGAIGLVWLIMWSFVSRRADVRDFKPQRANKLTASPRLTDPRMWSFILAYGLGATPLGFVLYAAAIYLSQAMGKDQAFLGKVLWIPPLGWEVGYFFWGWLVDRMTAAGAPRIQTVRRIMFWAMFLS